MTIKEFKEIYPDKEARKAIFKEIGRHYIKDIDKDYINETFELIYITDRGFTSNAKTKERQKVSMIYQGLLHDYYDLYLLDKRSCLDIAFQVVDDRTELYSSQYIDVDFFFIRQF